MSLHDWRWVAEDDEHTEQGQEELIGGLEVAAGDEALQDTHPLDAGEDGGHEKQATLLLALIHLAWHGKEEINHDNNNNNTIITIITESYKALF